jgi:hypothetical protein
MNTSSILIFFAKQLLYFNIPRYNFVLYILSFLNIFLCFSECCYAKCQYAECRNAKCCYAECHYVKYCYAQCEHSECGYVVSWCWVSVMPNFNILTYCKAECHYNECRYAKVQNPACCNEVSLYWLCWVSLCCVLLSWVSLWHVPE